MIKIVKENIEKKMNSNGFIFDGFPRTIPQAEAFDEMLAEFNMAISHVIHLKVSREILVSRLSKRSELENRKDDREMSTIENRIKLYIEKTTPIKEFYTKQGKMCKIEGAGDVDDIYDKIIVAISN